MIEINRKVKYEIEEHQDGEFVVVDGGSVRTVYMDFVDIESHIKILNKAKKALLKIKILGANEELKEVKKRYKQK